MGRDPSIIYSHVPWKNNKRRGLNECRGRTTVGGRKSKQTSGVVWWECRRRIKRKEMGSLVGGLAPRTGEERWAGINRIRDFG